MAARFSVRVRGDGVAALACARLLRNAGIGVSVESAERARVPALLLSGASTSLLSDIFGRTDLFEGLHRITSRRVAWGSEAIKVPHSGIVVAEDALIGLMPRPDEAPTPCEFIVYTTRPLPAPSTRRPFGSQEATGARATLRASADSHSCYVESLDNGWLFLVPLNACESWVLAVGATVETLLASSRLVADAVDGVEAPTSAFATSPGIADPPCAESWLACGSAALTLDPLCGDGTASAAREAILAAAVVSAIAEGGDRNALLVHYESLLIGAMRRHLALCADFYGAGSGPWWTEQCALLKEGHEWCTSRLALLPEPRYRLRNFDLVPIERG